jgi:H+/Cl- antiporter ClcA
VIPATLVQRGAGAFWLAVMLTGVGAGFAAAGLTLLLGMVQHLAWPGNDALLDAAAQAAAWRHILVLLGAGLATGAGQIILVRLSSANSIDISAAIWFAAGRLPPLRTLGSAILSVIIVGMGASLGREGAPKQAGAVTPVLCRIGGAYRTNSAGCWWRAVLAPEWRRPMEFRLGARCSRSKCYVGCSRCG